MKNFFCLLSLKGISALITGVRYFLPIWAISMLVNAVFFPSESSLLILLSTKSFFTTLLTIVIMLWGVKREKGKTGEQRSKIRLFFWYFLPMIPYLELGVLICWDNFSLFMSKTLVYLAAYGMLALYYSYRSELHTFSRAIRSIKLFKKKSDS